MFCVHLTSHLPAAEEPSLQKLVEQVLAANDQTKYDPQPLMKHGVAGMRAVLDQLFPEVTLEKAERDKKIAALIEQLGDDSFDRREAATVALRRFGSTSQELLRQALEHPDLEIRSRVLKLIEDAKKPGALPEAAKRAGAPAPNYEGLQMYVNNQRDVECRQEMAKYVTRALEARLDLTSKRKAIEVCLGGISRTIGDPAKDDRIQNELLPLLKLKDPAPAMLVLRINAGTESYVTPLHRGAIASENPALIRCAIQCMGVPRWDEVNRPVIKAALEKFFDGSEIPTELRNDFEFMFRVAALADEQFQSANARKWLIGLINSNRPVALPVMRALGEFNDKLKPMDGTLLAAVEPHTKSQDAKYRAAAVQMLGMYEGEGVLPLLIQALADPAPEVWKEAGARLQQQHYQYHAKKGPIPKAIADALKTSEDAAHKARLEYLGKKLQEKHMGFLKWEEIK